MLDSAYATRTTETIKSLKENDEHLLQLTFPVNIMLNLEKSSQKTMQPLNAISVQKQDSQGNVEQKVMQTFSSAALKFLLSINHCQKVETSLVDISTHVMANLTLRC